MSGIRGIFFCCAPVLQKNTPLVYSRYFRVIICEKYPQAESAKIYWAPAPPVPHLTPPDKIYTYKRLPNREGFRIKMCVAQIFDH